MKSIIVDQKGKKRWRRELGGGGGGVVVEVEKKHTRTQTIKEHSLWESEQVQQMKPAASFKATNSCCQTGTTSYKVVVNLHHGSSEL